MVVCLMRISSKSRKIIAIFDAVLIVTLIFLETFLVLLKIDKICEFHSLGVYSYLWEHDSLFLCSGFIVGGLLLFSVSLLVFVFDVAVSQENEEFHVEMSDYSSSIYLLLVSFVLCVLSFALSLRLSTEFDHKMTSLLMRSYLNYERSKESQTLVDRIHMEYSCCGVNSIEDLVDLSEVDEKLPPQTRLWSCNEWEYCSVPLSCCKSTSCSQKVEFLVDGWDPVKIMEKWFNKRGCVKEMDRAFFSFGFSEQNVNDFLMILILGFHLCGLILTQILVTASATLHGARLELSEYSYAWLLDVGQPDPKKLLKTLNPELLQSESSSQPKEEEEEGEVQPPEVEVPGGPSDVEFVTNGETASSKASDGTTSTGKEENGTATTSASASSTKIVGNISAAPSEEMIVIDADNLLRNQVAAPGSSGKQSNSDERFQNERIGSSTIGRSDESVSQEVFPESERWWPASNTPEEWILPLEKTLKCSETPKISKNNWRTFEREAFRNEKVTQETVNPEEMCEISITSRKVYYSETANMKIGSGTLVKQFFVPTSGPTLKLYINCSVADTEKFEGMRKYCKEALLNEPDAASRSATGGKCSLLTKTVTQTGEMTMDGRYEVLTVQRYTFSKNARVTFYVSAGYEVIEPSDVF
ncbi:unnamed protein product [Caenorhabditis sp. 36 PRJEB53466]|nr:unnamed protein product [Caenorhabditis sp. 36 PRJEB53466]